MSNDVIFVLWYIILWLMTSCLESCLDIIYHMPFLFVIVSIFWPLFDFKIFLLLLSSIFHPYTSSYDLPNTLHFLSSIFHFLFVLCFIICLLPYSIFCLYVPLLHFYYYLSTICPLSLTFPSWPWQLNISFFVTPWVIFYILHTTLFAILLQVL